MLSRRYSLNNKQILSVLKKGKTTFFNDFYYKFLETDSFKFAFSISTKVSKSAVIRNTIRRKFKAAVYSLLKNKELKPGHYFFVIKSVEFAKMKSNEIEGFLRMKN